MPANGGASELSGLHCGRCEGQHYESESGLLRRAAPPEDPGNLLQQLLQKSALSPSVTSVSDKNAGKKKSTKKVDLTDKLFNEIAPKYANRNGGYTRIVKIKQRKGDGAMEVLIELV